MEGDPANPKHDEEARRVISDALKNVPAEKQQEELERWVKNLRGFVKNVEITPKGDEKKE